MSTSIFANFKTFYTIFRFPDRHAKCSTVRPFESWAFTFGLNAIILSNSDVLPFVAAPISSVRPEEDSVMNGSLTGYPALRILTIETS